MFGARLRTGIVCMITLMDYSWIHVLKATHTHTIGFVPWFVMNFPCRWTTSLISSEGNTDSSVSTYGSLTSPRSLSGGGAFGWEKARGHAFLPPKRPFAEAAASHRSHTPLKVTPFMPQSNCQCDQYLRLIRVPQWGCFLWLQFNHPVCFFTQ